MGVEIVSKKIAEISKEKGYMPLNPSTKYIPMYIGDELTEGQEEDYYIEGRVLVPTYMELIKWIFDFNYSVENEYNFGENKYYRKEEYLPMIAKHLEFWYNTLIPELYDTEFGYQSDIKNKTLYTDTIINVNEFVLEGFIGMLINWFEKNGYYFHIDKKHGKYCYHFQEGFKSTNLKDMLNQGYDTKQQARHFGILKCFELIKGE
jgi:hypothetical protein